ncbi:MAG: ATP-dependent ligase [Naasia sp.]|nr:ATP-dependent ligase [Naasia sp.]
MGRLVYDGNSTIEVEDRALAHLQVVIGNKLRRAETFLFTWTHPEGGEVARTVVWMHPDMALQFQYTERAAPALNRTWLEELSIAANSSAGLKPTPEPEDGSRARPASS